MYGIDASLDGEIIGDIDFSMKKNGTLPVLNLSIFVHEQDPQKKTYCRVGIFGEIARNLSMALARGMMVRIIGKLSMNTWTDKDGQQKSGLSILASEIRPINGVGPQSGFVSF